MASNDPFDPLGTRSTEIHPLAQGLDRMVKALQEVGSDIEREVDQIVSDTGWKGDAAEKFRSKWETDYKAFAAMLEYADSCRKILEDLLSKLSMDGATFHHDVAEARAMGVQLGPNLAPPPEGRLVRTCQAGVGPQLTYPPTPAGSYAYAYDMDHALMIRHKVEAARALTSFHDSIATSGGTNASLTLAGLLFDLTPEIKALGQSAYAKLPSTLTKDLSSLSPYLDKGIASLLEHGESIGQTLDGVASVIDARTKTQELLDEGEEEGFAIWVPATGAFAGAIVGGATAVLIAGASPGLIVGGAAVVGGLVIGIGVNNLVTDFCDEHWDEDMHLYGPMWPVFGGAHVIGNTIADTAGNVGDILSPIGNLASPITNGVGDFMGGLGIHF